MHSKTRRFLVACTAMLAMVAAGCDDDSTGVTAPTTPTGVTASATGSSTIRVSWSQAASAESYELDRATGAGEFATIRNNLTATFFDDTDLQPNTAYRYRVRAVRGTQKSPFSVEVTATTQQEGERVAYLDGITVSRTLFADTTYVLRGYVKVGNGATLTIQPGTRIVGDTLVPGSSLWILRGSRLIAEGTRNAPIVFTSMRAPGHRSPGDWGGIVMVGNAPLNRTANPIFTEGPTGAAENYAGGNDISDSSGSLRYVRVEFAGYDVSNGAGQELNGISMYAVGSGTRLDHVQTVAGLDDSFEWWGGAADVRNLISFESGDDHFDWTEGYQGRGQFLIALQTDVISPRPGTGTVSSDPRGFEGDGCDSATSGCTFANAPYSMPTFANFTLIGPGTGVFSTTDGSGAVIRRGSGGRFVNGVIARWPGVGISIRDAESGALMAVDSLWFRNILLVENGTNFEAQANGRFGHLLNQNAAAWNIGTGTLAQVFGGTLPTRMTTVTTANVNLQPAAGSAAATGGLSSLSGTPLRTDGFFGGSMTGTAYLGAVAPTGTPWYEGWTSWVRN